MDIAWVRGLWHSIGGVLFALDVGQPLSGVDELRSDHLKSCGTSPRDNLSLSNAHNKKSNPLLSQIVLFQVVGSAALAAV